MRRTVLIGLIIVFLSTPCLAQSEIEGLCSINNTLWEFLDLSPYSMGLSDNIIYFCETDVCLPVPNSKIKAVLIVSIFSAGASSGTEEVSIDGLAFPLIGLGYATVCTSTTGCDSTLIKKVDDSWIP